MAFIKAHWISLATGLAAVVFIAIGVLGMMSDSVIKQMEEQSGIGGQIGGLRANPRNQAFITAEAARGEQFQKEYDNTLAVARRINERKPLMDDVFPAPAQESAKYAFREAYRRALADLPRGKLIGGDKPGDREIEEAKQDVADLLARKAEEQGEGGPTAPSIAGKPGGPPVPGPMPAPVGPSGVMVAGGKGGGGPTVAWAGGTLPGAPPGDPRYDPQARATITKARNIRCYISSGALHVSPIIDPTTSPTPFELWCAQVSLWVQQDVVNAIAELNDEEAQRLGEADAYVENMPVKRIESMHVLGYWTAGGSIPFALTGQTTPGDMLPSWTGRKCDNQFDVVRFAVTLVADQRALARVIDRLSRQNFCKLLDVASYHALTAADTDERDGYLYGAAPAVRVTLDFEQYMARDVFKKYFPTELNDLLGIK